MTGARPVMELHDLDQLLLLLRDEASSVALRRMGYTLEGGAALEREREKLAASIDRRWLAWYERSFGRYGRGLTLVRERVCQGCFVTLPNSASPPAGGSQLHLCENCGRLLFWA